MKTISIFLKDFKEKWLIAFFLFLPLSFLTIPCAIYILKKSGLKGLKAGES